MELKEIIGKYPGQYIAVAYVKKGLDNLIQTATVLKVYATLQEAYDNIREIRLLKSRYSDFDIVYGDYEDYVSVRRKKVILPSEDVLTQEQIDSLIQLIQTGQWKSLASGEPDICSTWPCGMGAGITASAWNDEICMIPVQIDISGILKAMSENNDE